MTGALASRLCGSADLYQRSGKQPINSVNFVTCHDGFTLNDLVSYKWKHNEANGEDGRDGADENYSANHGVEGATDDPAIESVRIRQIKNLLTTLFLSRGVPMLLGGDEFRRTQGGNNNAYCQDNAVSWYDWRLVDQNSEIFRFVRELTALRKRYTVLSTDAFHAAEEIEWFGPLGQPVEWDGSTRALGCLVRMQSERTEHDQGLCLLFNASTAAVEFQLRATEGGAWRTSINTANAPPNDIYPAGDGPSIRADQAFHLGPRAVAVLSSK
jgi:glycogen operon protein